MLDHILLALAVIGGGGYIVGRWLMIHDSGGNLGMIWIIALRYIPLSELMYLVRFYNQAKRGGFICIIGMWLMVPWLGNRLWLEQKTHSEEMAKYEGRDGGDSPGEGGENGGDNEEGTPQGITPQTEELSDAYYDQDRVAQKQQKVTLLQSRLAAWYQQMQQRRATLGTDPAAVQAFNAEAAAYASLNAVAKEESAELAAMQGPAK